MSDTDPLLRAVADGNPAAPDGEALVRLGRLVRTYARPQASDLTHQLRTRLQDVNAAPLPDTDATRDHHLLELIRHAATPPQPVDLTAAVRRRLQRERFLPASSAPRRRAVRILATVLAGHVAAALILGMVHIDLTSASHGRLSENTARAVEAMSAPRTVISVLPPRLPTSWPTAHEADADLLLPRRLPELRETLRTRAGLGATAPRVHASLAWLGDHAANAPTSSRTLAVLALLGEGDDDAQRTTIARRLLASVTTEPLTPATCLALTEAAILWRDETLRRQAESALAALDATTLTPSNDGGFALLALELAQAHGFAVPGPTLMSTRRTVARTLPADEADTGRIGLAAFARFMFGLRHNPSTHHLVDLLAIQPPDRQNPATHEQWFFAALAVNAEGGPTQTAWNQHLADAAQSLMQPHSEPTPSVARSPDHDDVAITARTLIALQAPYRYVPIAE